MLTRCGTPTGGQVPQQAPILPLDLARYGSLNVGHMSPIKGPDGPIRPDCRRKEGDWESTKEKRGIREKEEKEDGRKIREGRKKREMKKEEKGKRGGGGGRKREMRSMGRLCSRGVKIHSFCKTTRCRGVKRGQMPPLNLQNFLLHLIEFSLIPGCPPSTTHKGHRHY